MNGRRIRNTEQQKASHTMTNEEELEIQNNEKRLEQDQGRRIRNTEQQKASLQQERSMQTRILKKNCV